jgi:hypothetical protein
MPRKPLISTLPVCKSAKSSADDRYTAFIEIAKRTWRRLSVNAGRSGADQHKCEKIAITTEVFFGLWLLEGLQNAVAYRNCIRERFQCRRKFLEVVV